MGDRGQRGDARLPRPARTAVLRVALAVVAIAVVVTVGLLLPYPSVSTVRAWADSAGPWFVILFFLTHVVVTVFPVPRTVFTVSAGVLFGPVGIVVCVLASTVSAAIALLGVREIERRHPSEVLDRVREHRAYAPVATRLRRRGWLAVGSLRLIAAMPFSVLNYACALSPVRFWPYLVATVVGLLPGTAAVVLLGDAAVNSSMWPVAISAALFALGIVGLLVDAARPAK